MSIDRRAARGRVLATLVVLGLVCPAVVSADQIRVLFVAARDAEVDLQVAMLERAIRQSPGPLALAGNLTEAHVVIRFTQHRRSTGKDGEPLFHWMGEAKLLKLPEGMTVSATPLSERFGLVVIGKEGNEPHRALELLETVLTKTIRPKARQPPREAI